MPVPQIIESPDVVAKRKRLREKAVELSQILVGMMSYAYESSSLRRRGFPAKKYEDIRLSASHLVEEILRLLNELRPFPGDELIARNFGNRLKALFDHTKEECGNRVQAVYRGSQPTKFDPWIIGKRWDENFAILEKAYLFKRRFYQGWTDGFFSNRILRLGAANYAGFKV